MLFFLQEMKKRCLGNKKGIHVKKWLQQKCKLEVSFTCGDSQKSVYSSLKNIIYKYSLNYIGTVKLNGDFLLPRIMADVTMMQDGWLLMVDLQETAPGKRKVIPNQHSSTTRKRPLATGVLTQVRKMIRCRNKKKTKNQFSTEHRWTRYCNVLNRGAKR